MMPYVIDIDIDIEPVIQFVQNTKSFKKRPSIRKPVLVRGCTSQDRQQLLKHSCPKTHVKK